MREERESLFEFSVLHVPSISTSVALRNGCKICDLGNVGLATMACSDGERAKFDGEQFSGGAESGRFVVCCGMRSSGVSSVFPVSGIGLGPRDNPMRSIAVSKISLKKKGT